MGGTSRSQPGALPEVNESIAELEQRLEAVEREPVFICECSKVDCVSQIPDVDLATYARVREDSRWFFLLPGHQDPQIERIIETHPGYLVVEKTGAAGDVAARTRK